jgi:hypothetical protein
MWLPIAALHSSATTKLGDIPVENRLMKAAQQ